MNTIRKIFVLLLVLFCITLVDARAYAINETETDQAASTDDALPGISEAASQSQSDPPEDQEDLPNEPEENASDSGNSLTEVPTAGESAVNDTVQQVTDDSKANNTGQQTTDSEDNQIPEPPLMGASSQQATQSLEDTTAPTINDIQIGATTVEAPGTIDVIMDASDDVSGLSWATVCFYLDGNESSSFLVGRVSPIDTQNSYWNGNEYVDVLYADGKLHGEITVDEYTEPGKYIVKKAYVGDNASNSTSVSWNNLFFYVTSATPDTTGPTINDIQIGATTVEAPGTIDVIMDASDDVSGLSWGSVCFYLNGNENSSFLVGRVSPIDTQNSYWNGNEYVDVLYADGKLHGEITVDEYTEPGKYIVRKANAGDNASNISSVSWDGLFFYVTNSTPDTTAPIIEGINISTTYIETPGYIDVIMDASDDVSGLSWATVCFYLDGNESSSFLVGRVSPIDTQNSCWNGNEYVDVLYADGKLHGKITVDPYTAAGKYVVKKAYAGDNASNSTSVSWDGLFFVVKNTGNDWPKESTNYHEEVLNEPIYLVNNTSESTETFESLEIVVVGNKATVDIGVGTGFTGNRGNIQSLQNMGCRTFVINSEKFEFELNVNELLKLLGDCEEFELLIKDGVLQVIVDGQVVKEIEAK